MHFRVVATDYDGTIAHEGKVEPSLVGLFKEFRASGRKLILVTGRHMSELRSVFSRLEVFDLVVGENGALVFNPDTAEERLLSEPIPATFVRELRRRGVGPLSPGRGTVATWRSQEGAVLEAIRDMGLDLKAIPNKTSIVVMPAGVDKGSGLKAALHDLRISPHSAVGIGDAENDHDFLRLCGCSVAVSNALESVKESVDIVTRGAEGDGVAEILTALLADDLSEYDLGVGTGHRSRGGN